MQLGGNTLSFLSDCLGAGRSRNTDVLLHCSCITGCFSHVPEDRTRGLRYRGDALTTGAPSQSFLPFPFTRSVSVQSQSCLTVCFAVRACVTDGPCHRKGTSSPESSGPVCQTAPVRGQASPRAAPHVWLRAPIAIGSSSVNSLGWGLSALQFCADLPCDPSTTHLFFFNPHLRTCLREEGRVRGRERNNDVRETWISCLWGDPIPPKWASNLQPRYVL